LAEGFPFSDETVRRDVRQLSEMPLVRTDQLEEKDVESFRCSTQIDRYLTAFLKCPEQIR
jgi:hypothetical protein